MTNALRNRVLGICENGLPHRLEARFRMREMPESLVVQ
jgi:hypothetical protein